MRGASLVLLLCSILAPASATAQRGGGNGSGFRSAYVDDRGVIRWKDSGEEVALFGANYTLPSASDYRAAGYVTRDRKKLIDQDMAHFARMGWNGLRVALWGDWENSDREGNLIENDHLDLMDYLIARARERGIYILFSPIQTYNAGWPDSLQKSMPGFSRHFPKSELGRSEAAIAAQVSYIKQLLNHVNPYTGTALKDEPSILFIEMINEPAHHSDDLEGSIKYINALVDAVRSTGCDKILFHNVSQDFRIAEAIRRSKVQGISFGWYPTGLNSGRELEGNYLRTVDDYPPMRIPGLENRPRIVYEFDSADLLTGYMYPAMVRAFRSVGAQFAAMFAYDMLATAPYNLGWQTHYLNLVYTPRKAVSAVIAAEAMRRLPRLRSYGPYPRNTRFGDFRVSYEENLSELVTSDVFMHAGTTRTAPPHPERLRRIVGYGSSPVVRYEGEGAYFLDRIREGVWRLEVYPDAVPVNDPFELQSPDKVVTRAIHRAWPMRIDLPDLGPAFLAQPVTAGNPRAVRAEGGQFTVLPGVYVLSARGPVDRKTLPAYVGRLRFDEYHAPPPEPVPMHVEAWTAPEFLDERPVEISARVVTAAPPEAVILSIRPLGAGRFRAFPMRPAGGYDYRVSIPADSLGEGFYEYMITVTRGDSAVTFPERLPVRPWDWNFYGRRFWKTAVVRADRPLRLFRPAEDVPRMAFTRIGDAIRRGIYRVVPGPASGEPAFHLELPVFGGRSPEDYTASLVIKERIAARHDAISNAKRIELRMRGLGQRQVLHVTLVERDGTSWSAAVQVDSSWTERSIPLSEFRVARSAKLPMGFPGNWNYWLEPAEGRGGPGDGVRIGNVERIQFSLRREDGVEVSPGTYGVEIESVSLRFEDRRTALALPPSGK